MPDRTVTGNNQQQMLFMYTWNGDTNLDGMVNSEDVSQFLANRPGGTNAGATDWNAGHFDYTPRVETAADVSALRLGLDAYKQYGSES